MLIGIVGHMNSGKSLLTTFLTESCDTEEYIMAGTLKEIAVLFGFNRQHVYGTQKEKQIIDPLWGVSPREFLQKFGTDICRDIMPVMFPCMKKNIWLQIFCNYYKSFPKEKTLVISDVRFQDEAECVRKLGGVLIRIKRDVADNVEHIHRSEQEINQIACDLIIDNNGTIDDLFLMSCNCAHNFK